MRHLIKICGATFLIATAAADERDTTTLLRLSVACQNASFERVLGEWQRVKFAEYIRIVDQTMEELVKSGYLTEQHFLMKAPSEMGGNERVQFEQHRTDFLRKHAPKFGSYVVIEMMGWEFRDQLEEGRFYPPDRDESKNYELRVRLPEKMREEFEDLLKDFIVRKLPTNKKANKSEQATPMNPSD